MVEACDSWNCAVAATVMSNGDKYVFTLPTNSDDYKWIVLRRVVAGSFVAPANAPYQIETFGALSAAMTRYSTIDQQLQPLMMTGTDGTFLVVARSAAAARRRAVPH